MFETVVCEMAAILSWPQCVKDVLLDWIGAPTPLGCRDSRQHPCVLATRGRDASRGRHTYRRYPRPACCTSPSNHPLPPSHHTPECSGIGMSSWWPLLRLLSWCPIIKSSHCNLFEDQSSTHISSAGALSSNELQRPGYKTGYED